MSRLGIDEILDVQGYFHKTSGSLHSCNRNRHKQFLAGQLFIDKRTQTSHKSRTIGRVGGDTDSPPADGAFPATGPPNRPDLSLKKPLPILKPTKPVQDFWMACRNR